MTERNVIDSWTGEEVTANIPDEFADDPTASSDWYNEVYKPYQDVGLEAAAENPDHPLSFLPDSMARGLYRFGQIANINQVKLGWDNPENAAKDIKNYEDYLLKLPYTENTKNWLSKISEANDPEDFWGSFGEYIAITATEEGGLGALLDVTLESLGVFLPTMVTATLTGQFLKKKIAPVAAMAGVYGLGSFGTEYGASVLEKMDEFLIERGIAEGIGNNEAVVEMFKNKAKMEEFSQFGVDRGLPIAAMDALSMGIAGKLYAAVTGTMKKADKLIKAAEKAKKTGKPVVTQPGTFTKASAIATEALGVQPFLGGLGEYLGQKSSGQDRNWSEVFTEAVAELAPGSLETGMGLYLLNSQKRKSLANVAKNTKIAEEHAKDWGLTEEDINKRIGGAAVAVKATPDMEATVIHSHFRDATPDEKQIAIRNFLNAEGKDTVKAGNVAAINNDNVSEKLGFKFSNKTDTMDIVRWWMKEDGVIEQAGDGKWIYTNKAEQESQAKTESEVLHDTQQEAFQNRLNQGHLIEVTEETERVIGSVTYDEMHVDRMDGYDIKVAKNKDDKLYTILIDNKIIGEAATKEEAHENGIKVLPRTPATTPDKKETVAEGVVAEEGKNAEDAANKVVTEAEAEAVTKAEEALKANEAVAKATTPDARKLAEQRAELATVKSLDADNKAADARSQRDKGVVPTTPEEELREILEQEKVKREKAVVAPEEEVTLEKEVIEEVEPSVAEVDQPVGLQESTVVKLQNRYDEESRVLGGAITPATADEILMVIRETYVPPASQEWHRVPNNLYPNDLVKGGLTVRVAEDGTMEFSGPQLVSDSVSGVSALNPNATGALSTASFIPTPADEALILNRKEAKSKRKRVDPDKIEDTAHQYKRPAREELKGIFKDYAEFVENRNLKDTTIEGKILHLREFSGYYDWWAKNKKEFKGEVPELGSLSDFELDQLFNNFYNMLENERFLSARTVSGYHAVLGSDTAGRKGKALMRKAPLSLVAWMFKTKKWKNIDGDPSIDLSAVPRGKPDTVPSLHQEEAIDTVTADTEYLTKPAYLMYYDVVADALKNTSEFETILGITTDQRNEFLENMKGKKFDGTKKILNTSARKFITNSTFKDIQSATEEIKALKLETTETEDLILRKIAALPSEQKMDLHAAALKAANDKQKVTLDKSNEYLRSQLRARAGYLIQLRAGLREQEHIQLPIESVKALFDQARIKISRGEPLGGSLLIRWATTKTDAGERTFPVGEELIIALKDFYDFRELDLAEFKNEANRQKAREYFFTTMDENKRNSKEEIDENKKDMKLHQSDKWWSKQNFYRGIISDRARINKARTKPRRLRAAWITHLLESGAINAAELFAMLGHMDWATFQTYTRDIQIRDPKIIEKINMIARKFAAQVEPAVNTTTIIGSKTIMDNGVSYDTEQSKQPSLSGTQARVRAQRKLRGQAQRTDNDAPVRDNIKEMTDNDILQMTNESIQELSLPEIVYILDRLNTYMIDNSGTTADPNVVEENLKQLNAAKKIERNEERFIPTTDTSTLQAEIIKTGGSDVLPALQELFGSNREFSAETRRKSREAFQEQFGGFDSVELGAGIWAFFRNLGMPYVIAEKYVEARPAAMLSELMRQLRQRTQTELENSEGVVELYNLPDASQKKISQFHYAFEELSRWKVEAVAEPDGGLSITIPIDVPKKWKTITVDKNGRQLKGKEITKARKAGKEVTKITVPTDEDVYKNGKKQLDLFASFGDMKPGDTVTLTKEEYDGFKASRNVYRKALLAYGIAASIPIIQTFPLAILETDGSLSKRKLDKTIDFDGLMDEVWGSIVDRLTKQRNDAELTIESEEFKEAVNNWEGHLPFSFTEEGHYESEGEEKIKVFEDGKGYIEQLDKTIALAIEARDNNKRLSPKVINKIQTELIISSDFLKVLSNTQKENIISDDVVDPTQAELRALNTKNIIGNITALQLLYDTRNNILSNPNYLNHQRMGKYFFTGKIIDPINNTSRTLIVESEDPEALDLFKRGRAKKRLEKSRKKREEFMRKDGWNFDDKSKEYVEFSGVRTRDLEDVKEYLTKGDIPILERLSVALGYTDDPEVQKFIDDIENLAGTSGAGKFLAHRKVENVLGYVTPENVTNYSVIHLSDYIRTVANAVSTTVYRNAVGKVLNELGKVNKEMQKYWDDHFKFMKTPENWSGVVKSFTFHQLLGYNVSSAMINASQTFMITAPLLKSIIGTKGVSPLLVTRTLGKAMRHAFKISNPNLTNVDSYGFDLTKETMPERLRGVISEFEWTQLVRQYKDGLIQASTNMEMGTAIKKQMAWVQKKVPAFGPTLAWILKTSAWMFGYIEQINRITASLATLRLASMPGMEQKFKTYAKNNSIWSAKGDAFTIGDAADMVVLKSQYLISKENRPQFFQKPVFNVASQFQSYTLNTISLWSQALRMTAGNKWPTVTGRQAKKMSAEELADHRHSGSVLLGGLVFSTLMAGGLMGMPFGDNLKEILKLLSKQARAHGFDLELGIREAMMEFGLPGAAIDAATRGPLSVVTGTDVSRRMTVSEVLPYDLVANDLTVAVGPTGAIAIEALKRAKAAIEDMHTDNWGKPTYRLLSSVFPLAARNLIDGSIGMVDPTEPIRTSTGRVILPNKELNTLENTIRMLGFTPHTVRQERLYKQMMNQLDMKSSSKQDYYYSQLAKIMAKRDILYAQGDIDGYKNALKVQRDILENIRENNREALAEGRPEETIKTTNDAIRQRLLGETLGIANPAALRGKVSKKVHRFLLPEMREKYGLGK